MQPPTSWKQCATARSEQTRKSRAILKRDAGLPTLVCMHSGVENEPHKARVAKPWLGLSSKLCTVRHAGPIVGLLDVPARSARRTGWSGDQGQGHVRFAAPARGAFRAGKPRGPERGIVPWRLRARLVTVRWQRSSGSRAHKWLRVSQGRLRVATKRLRAAETRASGAAAGICAPRRSAACPTASTTCSSRSSGCCRRSS